ncbi:MAG TPA: LLM class flavin-dependent oxidoreductase [Jatrophihabitans sp.]|uniref:LLM class flavin-dependent oxidoreductase n=1 Tax=Jatrophihabitans sp. TaxID=1932789 RepID=UPI002F1DD14E
MTARRFGVMLYPDQPVEVLVERALWLEQLGFDQVYLPDHSGDLRDRRGTWHDSWLVLAAIAVATSRVRLGTMVANQILRPPAQLAQQAMTLDHLSAGRLDLGIGAGIFSWDHHSVGGHPWEPKERLQRFADYVAIADGLLRADEPMFSFAGPRLWVQEVATAPGCVQSPRPPIILGGQSPTVLRTAAALAQGWNTHGPPGASAEDTLDATARQNRRLTELARLAGRDPAAIRRGYTIFRSWDPKMGKHTYEEVFYRFGEIGVSDFVLDWPGDTHLEEFARVATEVIPPLRE